MVKAVTSTKIDGVVPSIPLPSADLIIYRFDQIDEQLKATNIKLDKMTTSFVTKEEIAILKGERDQVIKELQTNVMELRDTDNQQQGAINLSRRLTTYGLTVLGILVAGIATYVGLHK